MIWKRLKKATPEQEQEFKNRMEGVPLQDKVIMTVTAFFVLVIPCLLVIGGMCLLLMWMFGML